MACPEDPFFSVIIPTFNRADLLPRCLESVLGQRFQDFELLVVDDGSTDETPGVLKPFLKEKVFYLNSSRGGVSRARNLGSKMARGQWLAFLDSDDLWFPEKLTLQYEFIQKNPSAVLVHGEEVWIRNGVRVNPMKKHKKGGGDQFERSLKLCLISPSATVIKRSLFFELGGFDSNFPVCEDYDLWLRLLSFYEVGFIETPLIVKFGGHKDQLSKAFVGMDYWRVLTLEKLLDNPLLGEKKKRQTAQVLLEKTRILVQGYHKHQNFTHLSRVEGIRQKACSFLSTHRFAPSL